MSNFYCHPGGPLALANYVDQHVDRVAKEHSDHEQAEHAKGDAILFRPESSTISAVRFSADEDQPGDNGRWHNEFRPAASPCQRNPARLGLSEAGLFLNNHTEDQTGYRTGPLGTDVAAAARIPFPAHRHSVVAAH